MTPAGSPITVKHPPALAASTIAQPMTIRCLLFCTMLCIMVSIMVVVVRLSKLAEIMNVATVMLHSNLLLLRVRIHSPTKSKHPLLLSISTIDIVASKNSTMAAALPTYLMNKFSPMKYLTARLECCPPPRYSIYSCGCWLMTKSVP